MGGASRAPVDAQHPLELDAPAGAHDGDHRVAAIHGLVVAGVEGPVHARVAKGDQVLVARAAIAESGDVQEAFRQLAAQVLEVAGAPTATLPGLKDWTSAWQAHSTARRRAAGAGSPSHAADIWPIGNGSPAISPPPAADGRPAAARRRSRIPTAGRARPGCH